MGTVIRGAVTAPKKDGDDEDSDENKTERKVFECVACGTESELLRPPSSTTTPASSPTKKSLPRQPNSTQTLCSNPSSTETISTLDEVEDDVFLDNSGHSGLHRGAASSSTLTSATTRSSVTSLSSKPSDDLSPVGERGTFAVHFTNGNNSAGNWASQKRSLAGNGGSPGVAMDYSPISPSPSFPSASFDTSFVQQQQQQVIAMHEQQDHYYRRSRAFSSPAVSPLSHASFPRQSTHPTLSPMAPIFPPPPDSRHLKHSMSTPAPSFSGYQDMNGNQYSGQEHRWPLIKVENVSRSFITSL